MDKKIAFKGTILLFLANAIGFVLGYVKDMLIVRKFGTSHVSDAWYLASSIPDLLYKFLLFGALGAAFLPVFVTFIKRGNEEEGWQVASTIINGASLVFVIVATVGMVLAPYLVYAFAPGFDAETHALATELTRIGLFLLAVMGISGFLDSICKAYFYYAVSAFAQVINLAVVLFWVVVFINRTGIYSVAWGTLIGYLASFIILVLFLYAHKKPYQFILRPGHPAVKEIMFLMIPLIGTDIIGKGIGLVDRIFISYLDKGSITIFTLANKLFNFPINFFPVTIAAAIFPLLARDATMEDKKDFSETLFLSMKISLLIMAPCIAGFVVFGRPILNILYQYGKFTSADTLSAWKVILCLCPALIPFSILPILMQACYSLKRNWLLLQSEALGFILNIIFDYILFKIMGLYGIALATTIVVTATSTYLCIALRKSIRAKGLGRFSLKVSLGILAMSAYSYVVFNGLANLFPSTRLGQLMALFFSIASSGLVYIYSLKLMRSEEVRLLWSTVKGSLIKRQISLKEKQG